MIGLQRAHSFTTTPPNGIEFTYTRHIEALKLKAIA